MPYLETWDNENSLFSFFFCEIIFEKLLKIKLLDSELPD